MRKVIYQTFFFMFVLLFNLGEAAVNPNVEKQVQEFFLQTKAKIKEFQVKDVGTAWIVDKTNFPALQGVTCFTLELWDESMRLPHWHPNAAELGYVISGTVEIILWRSPGETAMFTVGPGSCWFIPQGALHSLNNVGQGKAQLLVGFSSDHPQDVDLPVAFNGIPVPVREAYTSPHSDLKKWEGVINNPLVGKFTPSPSLQNAALGSSPYKFDLAQVPPLFSDPQMGSVVWGVKNNWSILKSISILRARLKPGIARDAIWYPDAGTLYVVSRGTGEFHVIVPGEDPQPLNVKPFDYIFVPVGTLHTFINNSSEDFEVIAFFTQENPAPEVSLSVATAFFPNSIRKEAMTEYGDVHKSGDPLKDLKFTALSPYLLRLPSTNRPEAKIENSEERSQNQ